MVEKEIVLETIKRMYDSGIEDSIVKQTLRDIGLSDSEISKYMAEAKGIPTEKPAEPEPEKQKESELKESLAEEREAQEAMHTTTHMALQQNEAKTVQLAEKVGAIEKKLGSIAASSGQGSPQSMAAINQRLAAMEKQLREAKAEIAATKAIMEKILETERKVLNRL